MKRSARELAVERLLRIEEEGAYLGRASDGGAADAREERQARAYVAGVTRQRRWLDFLLAHFYQGDYEGMEAPLRQVLRVGLFDLLFLSTPPHAAVHEAVEQAKRRVRPGAAGLVNALLRNAQRQQDALPQPDTGDAARDRAIRHSYPTWMVRRWTKRFGPEETDALLESHNRRPSYGLRLNALQESTEAFYEALDEWDVGWEPSAWLEDFVRVERLQPILRAGWLEEGRCAVQDESAALAVRLLAPRPGETVIDGCAAPGGKSAYAAALMEGEGRLWAYDRHAGRLERVQEAAQAQGFSDMITCEAADLRAVAQRADPPQAEVVLLDAPCSGLGVLARRADLRWRRQPEDLHELAALQDELLDAAAQLVQPGGRLVYSTCTTEPEENEQRVRAFLDRRDDFALEPAGAHLPQAICTPEGFMATLPHRHGTDGAFAARLHRRA